MLAVVYRSLSQYGTGPSSMKLNDLENLINKFFANFASKKGSKSSSGGAKEQK